MKIDKAEFVRSVVTPDQLFRDDRPEVAFIGRSNVGKSSLLNRLLGRKGLARVSSTPGRTRAVNYFVVNGRFYFVDLPGYGYARAAKTDRRAWADLADAYCQSALPESQVVLLIDAIVGATDLDQQAFEYLSAYGGDVAVVATKVDRLSRNKQQAAAAGIGRSFGLTRDQTVTLVSARSGEGLRELWASIDAHLRSRGNKTA